MTVIARKRLWWSMLAGSMGGTAFFVYICLMEGPPPARMIGVWLWPGTCLLVSFVSAILLRRIYREEPGGIRGLWQLSIIDLYAIIGVTAVWMAAMRGAWPSKFVPAGIAVSLVMGVGYTASLLVAARKGYAGSLQKIPYAAGLLLTALGLLAVGAVFVVCIFMLFYGRAERIGHVIKYMLYIPMQEGRIESELLPLRIGMLFLPVGAVTCWWVRRLSLNNANAEP